MTCECISKHSELEISIIILGITTRQHRGHVQPVPPFKIIWIRIWTIKKLQTTRWDFVEFIYTPIFPTRVLPPYRCKIPWCSNYLQELYRQLFVTKRQYSCQNAGVILTWLASMKRSRLYAAPAQAVLAIKPVVLIILWFNGKITNKRGMYWKRTIRARVLLEWPVPSDFVAGITYRMTIWSFKQTYSVEQFKQTQCVHVSDEDYLRQGQSGR